ncbi:hypothetical protein, partial [Paenibacillus plantiphilus]
MMDHLKWNDIFNSIQNNHGSTQRRPGSTRGRASRLARLALRGALAALLLWSVPAAAIASAAGT